MPGRTELADEPVKPPRRAYEVKRQSPAQVIHIAEQSKPYTDITPKEVEVCTYYVYTHLT